MTTDHRGADVQLEHGYTRIANRLLAALAAAPWDSASQSALVLSLIRMTYGARGRTEAVISTQEWATLTGLSIAQVKRARAALEKNGVLRCTQDEDQKRGVGKTWRLEKDFTRWKRFRVDTATVAEAEAVVAQSLAEEGGSPPDPGSPTTPGSPMTPPAENADDHNAPAGPQSVSEYGDTAQGGSSTTPGTEMNPGSQMNPGTEMNPDPGTEMNPRTPPNVAQPRGISAPKERERKRITTLPVQQHPGEAAAAAAGVEELDWGDDEAAKAVRALPREARVALSRLTHRGKPPATAASLFAKFLFPPERTEFADPTMESLDPEQRKRLVAEALLELADQGGAWSSRRLSGFIRTNRVRLSRKRIGDEGGRGFIATDADFEPGGIYHRGPDG